jgi:hypothetical protein|tara:strand:+ start:1901 stop:2092 length:192 start_codon:yes stop_codon:yes gene_type:complete
MKIGDLVSYSGSPTKLNGKAIQTDIGIVINLHSNSVVTVLWSNGVESNHSSGWIVRIKESTCK